jgi:hypothetical protein
MNQNRYVVNYKNGQIETIYGDTIDMQLWGALITIVTDGNAENIYLHIPWDAVWKIVEN